MNAPDLGARIREAKAQFSLADVIGHDVKLKRAGREFKGCCPFHDERTASFTVVEDKGFYHCFGCGAHGDVIQYLQDARGLGPAQAVAFLMGDPVVGAVAPAAKRETTKDDRPSPMIDGRQAALAVWNEAQPARGSLAEAFMRTRGIDPASNGLLDLARFHPNCPAALWRRWEKPRDARRHAPALVTPMLRIDGARGEREFSLAGVHITYLDASGAKARFDPWKDRQGHWHQVAARVMWGRSKRVAAPILAKPIPAGADPRVILREQLDAIEAGPLVVAEGLESTQSLMLREPGARLGFAALSLGNLQGVSDRVGKNHAIPLHNPKPVLLADEEGAPALRPNAFTVADPGRVVVGVDADMKQTAPVWVQERRGDPAVKRRLSSVERTELCAALAAAQWRAAGAVAVTCKRPAMGTDFNDQDKVG